MVHEITRRQTFFGLNFGGLNLTVTLKIRSRLPKPIQLFTMSKCYIHANLVKIRQLVHEILCTQAPSGLKFGSLSPTVTLKIRSRSLKPNQLIIMSQCYIHANLVEIHPPVHEIVTHKSTVARTVMCRQDGRGRFPVLLDDHSKCRTNSQRKSQLS